MTAPERGMRARATAGMAKPNASGKSAHSARISQGIESEKGELETDTAGTDRGVYRHPALGETTADRNDCVSLPSGVQSCRPDNFRRLCKGPQWVSAVVENGATIAEIARSTKHDLYKNR